ncbi:TPA: CDP-alcohol phosphatidyltransferase family protein [archaeon]|uniref:CDP-alcohol phosphatidyltransferase family protein n=1 Tax=Candidatus Naiadarchaeum limnaeum TaxID=2756139 RepID=A0A832V0P0_9ARCH|nr:CDP-alcohol phosphatidyltransferase family protein [Candidatus Naiadarchaeum limnaeum]
MVLDSYRPITDRILKRIAMRLKGVNPDVFTWLALVFAILTGYTFYTGKESFLLLASLLVGISGFFDAMDGALARVSKLASKRGDFLDHVLDRYADIFIVGGLMFSPWVDDILGFFAIIGVILLSYMGTQAHALIGKRDYSGYLGRATRLLILVLAPLVHYFLLRIGIVEIYSFTFLEWVMIGFAFVGNITALQRAYNTWKLL